MNFFSPLLATALPNATQTLHKTSASSSLAGAFFALILILLLIVGLAWVLKRLPGGGFKPNEQFKVIASLMISNKDRLMVVEINGQQLLLGVGNNGIQLLYELPEPLPPLPPSPTFQDLKNIPVFSQFLTKKSS